MNDRDKPYPYNYTLNKNYPELRYVHSITAGYLNKFVTVSSHSYSHRYSEKNDGTVKVESNLWFDIKQMSDKAMQMCNYERPTLMCVIMTVGEFSNGATRIYKYDTIEKYKVYIRFYKPKNQNIISYMNDDSEHGNDKIRVGEFNGLFGNLINQNNLEESTLTEADYSPFNWWNSLKLWLSTPI